MDGLSARYDLGIDERSLEIKEGMRLAKENTAFLFGVLEGSPIINETNEEKKSATFCIKTLRRNDKIDYPVITVYEPDLIERVRRFRPNDFILVKGVLTTAEVKKGIACPHCKKRLKTPGTTTVVIGVWVYDIGEKHNLADFKESSNTLFVLGSLCRDVEFRFLKTRTVASAQYQLAVNRKFKVKQQPNNMTDYPWVNSFGAQAEQDKKRLQTGSQVFIQGGLQTRNIQKKITCPHCEKEFSADDFVAEIVPYSVEYLNNCLFEEKAEEGKEQKPEETVQATQD